MLNTFLIFGALAFLPQIAVATELGECEKTNLPYGAMPAPTGDALRRFRQEITLTRLRAEPMTEAGIQSSAPDQFIIPAVEAGTYTRAISDLARSLGYEAASDLMAAPLERTFREGTRVLGVTNNGEIFAGVVIARVLTSTTNHIAFYDSASGGILRLEVAELERDQRLSLYLQAPSPNLVTDVHRARDNFGTHLREADFGGYATMEEVGAEVIRQARAGFRWIPSVVMGSDVNFVYNSLRPGTELRFLDATTGVWVNYIYLDQNLGLRTFIRPQEVVIASADRSSRLALETLEPQQLSQAAPLGAPVDLNGPRPMIVPNTLMIRNPGVVTAEGIPPFADLWRGGLMPSLETLRQELRAERGLQDLLPFDRRSVIHAISRTSPIDAYQALEGQRLQVTYFRPAQGRNPRRMVTLPLNVRLSDDVIHFEVRFQDGRDANNFFRQVMESATGVQLDLVRRGESTRRIMRYDLAAGVRNQARVTNQERLLDPEQHGYFRGRWISRSNTLDITLLRAHLAHPWSDDLLLGLAWGQRLRRAP